MGNIGSQSGQVTQKHAQEEQWAHSFPRTQPRLQQHKVLPERDAKQKLRSTNNGEILLSGGTISGRPNFIRSLSLVGKHDERDSRTDDEFSTSRIYKSNQREPSHKGNRYTHLQQKHQNAVEQSLLRDKMKRFGSEPDLRYSTPVTPSDREMRERAKVKKKYKAPPPPKRPESAGDWDEDTQSQLRKNRLFKTQAETKNAYSSPVHTTMDKPRLNKTNSNNIEPPIQVESRSNRLSLPDLKLSSTDFQEELKEATKRLRYNKPEEPISITPSRISDNSKLKTLDPNIHSKEFRKKLEEISFNSVPRSDPSGKECSSEEKSPIVKQKEQPKTFYFGMDEPQSDFPNDIIDHFASNLHPIKSKQVSVTSDSDLSSEMEIDDCQISKAGIDLQLRPMLPKKQLEIPRFSPAAAWKLLSALDTSDPATSTIASDDFPVFIEDRIEKYSRPPPPTIQIGPRSSNDKSGDSGISGDAGNFDDSQENILNARNDSQILRNLQEASWTPQQDLEDDSSMEEGLNQTLDNRTDYQKRPHVFSLSLPRDNHLGTYLVDKNVHSSSLQKIKRSVSGVLNNLAQPKKGFSSALNQDQNDNWFLSKSAPNSLSNVPNSLETKVSQKEEVTSNTVPNSGRVMYLPEFDGGGSDRHRSRLKNDNKDRSKSADRSRSNHKLSVFSKSCENISAEVSNDQGPENLQDPPKQYEWKNSGRKPKKFTFQSTVRQIERKRLADKLSREAEKKECQRLRELEAMQKVEEEFQKKRAREKASIRQQLRLFTLDEPWSSLPPNIELKDEMPVRQEPDGAISSPTPPPLTSKTSDFMKKKSEDHKFRSSSESSEEHKIKMLNDYRQPQRDYKQFRSSGRWKEGDVKQTVHPKVVYHMPKAKAQNARNTNGTNYRKDFAHGVRSNHSMDSTNSDDSRNNSPRLYHSQHAPITRF